MYKVTQVGGFEGRGKVVATFTAKREAERFAKREENWYRRQLKMSREAWCNWGDSISFDVEQSTD